MHKVLRILDPHPGKAMHGMHPLVGMDVGPSPKRHVLHQRQRIQRQHFQIVGDGFVLVLPTSLWLLLRMHGRWSGVSRHCPRLIPLPARPNELHARLLQLVPCIVEVGLETDIQRLLREQGGDDIRIYRPNHLGHQGTHRNGLGHYPNASFALAARVQQCALDSHQRRRHVGLVVHQIEREYRIGIAVWQRQEICPADEEIAVKVADAHAPRAANAHHGLERRVLGQAPDQLALETRTVGLVSKAGIGVQRPCGNLGQVRQARDVNVRPRKEEHVHADLRPRELHRRILVPIHGGPEKLDLVGCAHDGDVLAGNKRSVPQTRQYALKDAHLSANVLCDSECRLERRTEARILGSGLVKHAGQIFQKNINDLPRLLQIHQ